MTVQTRALKEATFEAMKVGEELGPLVIDIDDHYVKKFAFAVDDYHPWYFGAENPFGRRVAHAASLVPDMLRLLNTTYDPDTETGLHQKEEFWLTSPAAVGERAILRGHFVDKYVKRGKGYVVTEAEARSESDGRLLVRHRSTEVARVPEGIVLGSSSSRTEKQRWVKGEYPSGTPQTALTPQTSIGVPVHGPVKWVHQAQMSVFSNIEEFWRSIHTDLDHARRAGFQGTLAQGLMGSMYLSEMGMRLFGAAWFTTGSLSSSYIHPVYAGDTLTAKGVVVDRLPSDGGTTIEVEVWLENQDAVKTEVGWIRGTLR